VLGVETLNLKGMARRKKSYRFGKSVADAGFAQFLQAVRAEGVVPRQYPLVAVLARADLPCRAGSRCRAERL
jgi:hypothetical protein